MKQGLLTHRTGWWGIQWVSGSQENSGSLSLFFFDHVFVGFFVSDLNFRFEASLLHLLSFTCSSIPPSNPSHNIQILSGRNSSSRALRDFVGTVKDRRSHSIPENPWSIPAVVEQEALCAPASWGWRPAGREPFRESVSGAAFTVPLTDWTSVPSFSYGAASGRRGYASRERHGEDGLT